VWTLDQFADSAQRVLDRYETEYSWWKWGDRATTIHHAWKLYRAAARNELGTLLLGDAKIRTNPGLLMNFGVTSGSGIGGDELTQIQNLMQKRRALAGPRSGAVVQALGPGSILNDQNWTPLVNDAFILGGVHTYAPFHWAEEGFDRYAMLGAQEFIQRREVFTKGTASPVALRRDEKYYQDKWKHYILGHSNFWMDGMARIFTRELIGLKTFGYTAVFTAQEVMFRPGGGGRPATFENYLNGLQAVNFAANDRTLVNDAISELLFGKPGELSNLATGKPQHERPGQHMLKKTGRSLTES
jgi:hypothetical protein